MAPVTNRTGGTSKSNPGAGTVATQSPLQTQKAITGSDKAGAGILTAMVIVGVMFAAWWINID